MNLGIRDYMKPGKMLDEFVAKDIANSMSDIAPPYSTDIAAAFDATKEVSLDAIQISYHSHDEPVSVTLALSNGRQVYADGDSEAHAICLALLKVKEKK